LREALDLDRSDPAKCQSAFPITLVIGKALWLDIPGVDGTFKALKLVCNNTNSADEQFRVSPSYSIIIESNFKRSAMSPFGAGTPKCFR
jgi:hypothetical protein